MSRGVRDLRDLICVSRLTFHESEEEDVVSDDNAPLKKELSSLSLSSMGGDSKREMQPDALLSSRIVSPDSGFVTNGSTGRNSAGANIPAPPDSSRSESGVFMTDMSMDDDIGSKTQAGIAKFVKSSKRKKKKRPELPLEPPRHDLPRPEPLPPVQKIPGTATTSEKDLEELKPSYQRVTSAKESRTRTRINFDDMLIYMDSTIIANWLTRANTAIQDITTYFNKGDSFVQFAHFWLTDFGDLQKRDIFAMEYDFLLDEFGLAFAVGRENRNIVRRDLLDLCGAVFKEYPVKLLGAKGPHIFLDYLDILSSEKHEQYKKLLSDVRCSTSNRQYAQWLLAARSFALVNVWSSVLNFYRNLVGESASRGMPILDLYSSKESPPHRRMLQAIRLGYVDVIHYLLISGHVSSTFSDSHRKTLLFSAVMHNQVPVVKYLLTKATPVVEVNQPADTGNTALHAAANNGNQAIVDLLCSCKRVDLNAINPQCENATPLHLAVMHGHESVVECLLKHGADPSLEMNGVSAMQLAKDFEHTEIVQILKESGRR